MKRISMVIAASIALGAGPAFALECGDRDPFVCLADHTKSELKRLSLTPNDDQAKSFDALTGFDVYLKDGPTAAVKQWEKDGLPVYDLILALLLADNEDDAERVALAAKKPFAFDADGKQLAGKQALAQMEQDVAAFYHGEETMAYARACVSDEAFQEEVGGSPEMRKGACRVPYDKRAVQRTFGMMQLLKGVSRDSAVEGAMQYAYRVPSCDVATAIVEIAPNSKGLGSDDETAAWKVLDMATVCAAELLIGLDL